MMPKFVCIATPNLLGATKIEKRKYYATENPTPLFREYMPKQYDRLPH